MTRSFRIRRLHTRLLARLAHGIFFIICVLLLLSFCGCSKANATQHRLTGQAGQLIFTYDSEWDVRDFNKPLLVGTKLDVQMLSVGKTPEAVRVLSAQSLTPEILSINHIKRGLVRIEATRPGQAKMRVQARDLDGKLREDMITWRVDTADEIIYFPERSSELGARPKNTHHHVSFYAGSRVEIPWLRYTSQGEHLIGFGAEPVRIRPSWTGRVDPTHQHSDTLKLVMPDVPVTFEVLPKENVHGERLIVEVLPVQKSMSWPPRLSCDSSLRSRRITPLTRVSNAAFSFETC